MQRAAVKGFSGDMSIFNMDPYRHLSTEKGPYTADRLLRNVHKENQEVPYSILNSWGWGPRRYIPKGHMAAFYILHFFFL